MASSIIGRKAAISSADVLILHVHTSFIIGEMAIGEVAIGKNTFGTLCIQNTLGTLCLKISLGTLWITEYITYSMLLCVVAQQGTKSYT